MKKVPDSPVQEQVVDSSSSESSSDVSDFSDGSWDHVEQQQSPKKKLKPDVTGDSPDEVLGCTIPCACHSKRHLNLQKWSEPLVFLRF